jgi:hypothetical protein
MLSTSAAYTSGADEAEGDCAAERLNAPIAIPRPTTARANRAVICGNTPRLLGADRAESLRPTVEMVLHWRGQLNPELQNPELSEGDEWRAMDEGPPAIGRRPLATPNAPQTSRVWPPRCTDLHRTAQIQPYGGHGRTTGTPSSYPLIGQSMTGYSGQLVEITGTSIANPGCSGR